MNKFDFILTFISEFFSNTGLNEMYTYIIASFGIVICIRVATIAIPKVLNKWD